MTEIPATPTEPTPTPTLTPTEATPTPPVSPIRSRRRLIIGIAAGLVVAVVAFLGLQLAFNALNANAIALYTSEAEHYSVMAPGEPTQEQAEIVLPLALPATATHWTDGELYYSVSSADAESLPPTPVWRGMFLHDVLVGALSDAPGVSAASLESSAVTNAFMMEPEEITLSGESAYRFTLTVDGAPAPFHIVFTGHDPRLYMVVYSDSADSRDEDFIDSFAFLD